MRVALFGGTFDPVHNGHLEIARAAADAFELDRVLFIPGGDPPHKTGGRPVDYESRYRMVELACRADPRFEASRLEDPVRLEGRPSYSIHTIASARSGLKPGDELFFLLGEDAFRELATWYRLDDVVQQVEFLVVSRGGEERTAEPPHPQVRFRRVDGVENPVSATEVRRAIQEERSAEGMIPAAVSRFIAAHRLYRDKGDLIGAELSTS